MRFVSYEFLLLLAVALVLYYTACRKCQWQLLLAASAVFYARSGALHLLFITATVASTFLASMAMAKRERKRERRLPFALCLVFNIGILAFFKYSPLAFPLGLSFYTLQTMGYLIDCYRARPGVKPALSNPFKLALFTSFFPQLTQGPISRFGELKDTLYARHELKADDFTEGLLRVALGLFKKLVIAERLMPLLGIQGGFAGWCVSSLLYAVTIYCDFTGGLDIAIGVARMFGIRLSENFDRPFYAKSVSEYWRRWHMTMGSWFRDYIFYPMSLWKPVLRLSKVKALGKRAPVWVATTVTWLATGLWHGATWNFVLWGLLNGLVILVSQELTPFYKKFGKKYPKLSESKVFSAFRVVRTFLLVAAIRSLDLLTLASGKKGLLSLPVSALIVLVAAVLLLVIGEHRMRKLQNPAARMGASLSLFLLTLVFGAYGAGYDVASFIYTRF